MKKLLLLALPLLLVGCAEKEEKRTPLGWCIKEIQTNEDYDSDFSYIFSEIQNYDDEEIDYHLKVYYITTFLDDRIGEWYCFVRCEHNLFCFGNKYTENEIVDIDCDLAREQFID